MISLIFALLNGTLGRIGIGALLSVGIIWGAAVHERRIGAENKAAEQAKTDQTAKGAADAAREAERLKIASEAAEEIPPPPPVCAPVAEPSPTKPVKQHKTKVRKSRKVARHDKFQRD